VQLPAKAEKGGRPAVEFAHVPQCYSNRIVSGPLSGVTLAVRD
jgi:hypothetical protein